MAADARVAPTSVDTAKLDAEVLQRLGANLLGESWTTLRRMIGDDLAVEMLASATREAAHELVDGPFESRAAEQAMQPGQFDVRTPVLAAPREVFGERLWRYRTGRRVHEVGIDARLELARSAGPWWALDGLAIVSERPLVAHTDDRGRLHAEHGPALAWSDGLEVWAWHGVAVDRGTVMAPESITVKAIDAERNIERRRVLVERFGEERLVREGGAKLVDQDEIGRLWRRDMPTSWPYDEAVDGGGGRELDARAGRLPQDVLPPRAAGDAISSRSGRMDVRAAGRRVPAGGRVVIGSCDYCGGYCQSARHVAYIEAASTCQNGHVGPWHGDNGLPREACSEPHPDWEGLDHGDCPICRWGESAGRDNLLAMRSAKSDRPVPATGSTSPAELDARLAAFIADTERNLRSTEPTDRRRVAKAVATYLGGEVRPIEFVSSPRAVTEALAEVEAVTFANATGLPDWIRDRREGWSMSIPDSQWVRRLRRALGEGLDADATARLGSVLNIATSVASALRRFEVVGDAGQFDRNALELAAAIEVVGSSARGERVAYLRLLRELAASCGPVAVLPDRIVVSERPLVLEADDAGRLHAEHGPALAYGDGLVVFAWHGVVVPEWVIREPDRITVEAIDAETNAEVRRVLVERFGAERLVREGGATLVDEDATGRLWRRELARSWGREEPSHDGRGGELDTGARRKSEDLLPSRAAEDDDRPRGGCLDVLAENQGVRANDGDLAA